MVEFLADIGDISSWNLLFTDPTVIFIPLPPEMSIAEGIFSQELWVVILGTGDGKGYGHRPAI